MELFEIENVTIAHKSSFLLRVKFQPLTELINKSDSKTFELVGHVGKENDLILNWKGLFKGFE
jgi:hypothetical protein